MFYSCFNAWGSRVSVTVALLSVNHVTSTYTIKQGTKQGLHTVRGTSMEESSLNRLFGIQPSIWTHPSVPIPFASDRVVRRTPSFRHFELSPPLIVHTVCLEEAVPTALMPNLFPPCRGLHIFPSFPHCLPHGAHLTDTSQSIHCFSSSEYFHSSSTILREYVSTKYCCAR